MIRATTLADLSGVQHRFFTRQGGVSAGLYSSLNCGYGSGDDPENVRENRRRVAASFERRAEDLLTVHQFHSTDVLTVADQQARVIGAAHAGWKGALTGVVEATINAMEKLGARRERLSAAIGPCIGRDSYEVGPEFPAPFLKRDEADAAFFRAAPRTGHFLFDLAGYLARRIAKAGVAVEATGHDTLTGDADFFSYRRNTLKGVRDYGRGLSAIALED